MPNFIGQRAINMQAFPGLTRQRAVPGSPIRPTSHRNSIAQSWAFRLNTHLLWCAPFALLTISTSLFWSYQLDDAYIHLRYAVNLRHTGAFEYNPGEHSFGTSSPFYVAIIACLMNVVSEANWERIPKWLSCLAHYGVLWVGVVSCRARLRDREASRTSAVWQCSLFLAIMLGSPLVVRWMQDGMETSLAAFLVVAGVVVILSPTWPRWTPSCLAIVATLLGMLRVDLLPHSLTLLCVGLFLRRTRATVIAACGAGAALVSWYCWVYATFGAVVPDTALAKAGGHANIFWLYQALVAVAAMSPAWLLFPLLAWCGVWYAVHEDRRAAVAMLALSGPLMVVLTAGVIRDQFIHGARYFVPSLLMAGAGTMWLVGRKQSLGRWSMTVTALAALLTVGITGWRWRHIDAIRFGVVRSIPQDLKKNHSVYAADIGLIGWATRMRVVDGSRLVNGRAAATMTASEWATKIASEGWPEFLILDESDVRSVLAALPGATCDEFRGRLLLPEAESAIATFYRDVEVMRTQSMMQTNTWWLWRRQSP